MTLIPTVNSEITDKQYQSFKTAVVLSGSGRDKKICGDKKPRKGI